MKGKLTATSVVGYLVSGELSEYVALFEQGSTSGTVTNIAFGLGAIYGLLRRFTQEYNKA